MRVARILCAMLVCGPPVCEVGMAVEADRANRHAETTHDAGSTDGARERQDRAPATASDGADQRSAGRGSARTGPIEGKPRQVVQSHGRTIRPNHVRPPQADVRIADHADPHGANASREEVAAASTARLQLAPSGSHAANRPVSATRATAGAGAVGGPQGRGPAVVGGPAQPRRANSGVIDGTAVRRKF
jgi:hypothetical protein